MAHFYASIQGSANTQGTRCGTKNSGIFGHIRGWNSGVEVVGHCEQDETDTFRIYSSGGSNGYERKLIAVIRNGEVEIV